MKHGESYRYTLLYSERGLPCHLPSTQADTYISVLAPVIFSLLIFYLICRNIFVRVDDENYMYKICL